MQKRKHILPQNVSSKEYEKICKFQEDDVLLHPEIRTQSGTVLASSWNIHVENQESKEDRSQNDPYLEVVSSIYQPYHPIDSDPKDAPHLVTGVQEEKAYCSPVISFGKRK